MLVMGCPVFAYYYFDVGMLAMGRAPAAATALKRANPESIVSNTQLLSRITDT